MKRRTGTLPKPDLSGGPFESQVPPSMPTPPPPPPRRPSGTIRETCSCGATIETPASTLGREAIGDWRHMHRHTVANQPEQDKPSEPDTLPAIGELRKETTVFGFFPPTVEATHREVAP